MSITLKKDVWNVRDPSTGTYRGSAIFSTTLPQDAAQIITETTNTLTTLGTQAHQTETIMQQNIATATAAVNAAVEQGVDPTLSLPGIPADAAACGDLKIAFENFLDEKQAIIQRSYLGNRFVGNSLNVIERGLTVELDGTTSQNTVLFLNKYDPEMRWGNGMNSNFFNIYNKKNIINITPGHTYQVYFKLISGTVSKGNVTYTSEQDFGSVNVVRVWLMKSDATTSSNNYVDNLGDTIIINESQVGTLALYVYSSVTANHAIFKTYLEDVTLKNS